MLLRVTVFLMAVTLAPPLMAQPRDAVPADATAGLRAFASDDDLRALLRSVEERRRAATRAMAPVAAAPAPAAAPQAAVMAQPGITNTQEEGVDEGGIVKQRGDILVILRRGRLFTVSTAGGRLRAVDHIDAYPPGAQARGDWYDEMLIAGDMVIVVGYSYSRGGTEVNRFRLDAAGRLSFVDAHQLRSNDYFSASNYASRLIGTRLVFYTPLNLRWRDDPLEALPAVKRWTGGAADAFRPIATAQNIFAPPGALAADPTWLVLHSVVTCDLAARDLDCSSVGVLGPSSRVFYVSGEAVYLWIGTVGDGRPPRTAADFSFIVRLPFGGARPSAIAARGMPFDQFSFRVDPAEGVLNVLVRAGPGRFALWEPEAPAGTMALIGVPLADFRDGQTEVRRRFYRLLPPVPPGAFLRNRFVGTHVLYGYGGRGALGTGAVVAARVQGEGATQIALAHGVSRIEAIGTDAVAVGNGADGSLGFTAIDLAGGARIGSSIAIPAATEGESRSHAFFFRPDPGVPDGSFGIMGLPIARAATEPLPRFLRSSAAMQFVRRQDGRFALAGELAARPRGAVDDGCQASCVDWYGNARPIFLGSRILALLGYELVEGRLAQGGVVQEVARINFAPGRRGS